MAEAEHLVIDTGNRGSKSLASGALLASLPGAEVLPLAREQENNPRAVCAVAITVVSTRYTYN